MKRRNRGSHGPPPSGRGIRDCLSVTGAFLKKKVHLRLLSVLNLSIASHSRKARGKGVAGLRDADFEICGDPALRRVLATPGPAAEEH
jgi:hypothetical protein